MAEETVASEEAHKTDEASRGLEKMSIWDVYYPSRPDLDKEAIPVASFPMIIYFWPTLLSFFSCAVLQSVGLAPSILGWWATGALAFNLLVIVTDLDQKKFAITVLVIIVAALGLYISTLKELAFAGAIGGWLAGFDLYYSSDVLWLITAFLSVFFLVGMIQPRFNYWRIEPNEFVHYIQPFGRDQSIPRLGSTVVREVPDVLELLLTFGGGTMVIRREGQVVARIEHVPFLGRRMVAIERMLGVTRVRHVGSS